MTGEQCQVCGNDYDPMHQCQCAKADHYEAHDLKAALRFHKHPLCQQAAKRIDELETAQDRIELLERTLRDCLESLEWYAWKAGHNDPRGLTPSPTSVIGQARALVRKCANCGQDKYAHPVSPELQCPEFSYFVKR